MNAREVINRALLELGIDDADMVETPTVLDALKAAGYEVVKLPELNEFEPGPFFDAVLTRSIAADLLARAVAAEKAGQTSE